VASWDNILRFDPEAETFEAEAEADFGEFEGGLFGEAGEMELAASLLEVTGEAELEQFLGRLISKAAGAAGSALRAPVGRALSGILKNAARAALPRAGTLLGTMIGGSAGGALGGKLATAAGPLFGLELEGLSPEDQEFEVARRFVRFAGEAAKHAATSSASLEPRAAAEAAMIQAARRYAPGFTGQRTIPVGRRSARTGRWVRAGQNIIVVNS
jgi:type IV secretory pathway TrbL component